MVITCYSGATLRSLRVYLDFKKNCGCTRVLKSRTDAHYIISLTSSQLGTIYENFIFQFFQDQWAETSARTHRCLVGFL